MKLKSLLFIWMTAILTVPAYSQEVYSILKDTVNIDEVVITGTKTLVNRNNVPLTVSSISGEKIASSSESALLPALAEQVPGMFVTERGITGFGVSTGAAGQVSLRGVGGSPNTQVLVLVDGNPQFMGIMGHTMPDAYIASDVEKVEVIRGPASTLYGTNAMGGVINIITRQQKEEGFTTNARVMYGSYNTQKYMVNGGFKKNGFSAFASFNHDGTDGHRESSEFKIDNGYLRIGYEMNDHLKIDAHMSLANFDATDPGPEGGAIGNSYDITRGMGAIVFDNKFSKANGSLRFFYNYGDHDISDGFHSTDKNYGVVLYETFSLFKGNAITVGADLKKYGGIAENLLAMGGAGIIFSDTTVTESAGYINIQQELFGKLTLNTGFRLEYNNVFGKEPVPTAGFSYRPSPLTTIKGSVSKGFRSPTIRELFMWAPANTNLEPERMINYEVSLLQNLLKNKLSAELTVFSANGNNLIQTVMTPQGPKNQNVGEFSNKGIELAATFKPLSSLSFNTTYSFLAMETPILAAPEHQLNINGTYKLRRFTFNLAMQHINGLNTQVKPTVIKDNYTLINSRISCVLTHYINVFVKGENLTNKNYLINYGYPMPGIVLYGGINIHL